MKVFKNLSKLQTTIFIILVCITGVLGYLFYDSYRTNIQNRDLIADTKIENKDLSQDLEIIKDKHEKLQKEVDELKSKVKKVSYKKKYKKKRNLYSAGKNSKYKKGKVSYKQLYYQLKKKCGTNKSYKKSSYKKSKYRNNSYKRSSNTGRNYNRGTYSQYSVGKYKLR